MKNAIILSALPKTWILDLDGTIMKHNGYKMDGEDTLLEGAAEFLAGIDVKDMVIFITSRTDREKELTESFLERHGIRYDAIIFNAPYGERILINDKKPSGLSTAIAVNTQRDEFLQKCFEIDASI